MRERTKESRKQEKLSAWRKRLRSARRYAKRGTEQNLCQSEGDWRFPRSR